MNYNEMIPCRRCGALCQETDECLCAECEQAEEIRVNDPSFDNDKRYERAVDAWDSRDKW